MQTVNSRFALACLGLALAFANIGLEAAITRGVRGRVTGPDGAPLAGIKVYDSSSNGTTTAADGSYELPTSSSSTQVFVCDCNSADPKYVAMAWPNLFLADTRAGLATATRIATPANTVVDDVNFQLQYGARFTVEVRGPGGAPIDANGTAAGCFGRTFMEVSGIRHEATSRQTCEAAQDRNDGTYRIEPLPTGRTYFFEAHPSGTGYLPLYYQNATTLDAATPVVVPSSPATLLSPQIVAITFGSDAAAGGSLSGRVTWATSLPVETIAVFLYRIFPANTGLTDAVIVDRIEVTSPGTLTHFDYAFQGLAPGWYLVHAQGYFWDQANRKYVHLSTLWRDGWLTTQDGEPFRIEGNVPGVDMLLNDTETRVPLFPQWFMYGISAREHSSSSIDVRFASREAGTGWRAVPRVPWLSTTPSEGSGTTLVRVTADASSLAPGDYEGVIDITVDGYQYPVPLIIQLTVAAAPPGSPRITSAERRLDFVRHQDGKFSARPFTLRNQGDVSGSYSFGISGLVLGPDRGTIAAGGEQVVNALPSRTVSFGSTIAEMPILTDGIETDRIPVSFTVTGTVTDTTRPLPPAEGLAKTRGDAADDRYTVIPGAVSNVPGRQGSVWYTDLLASRIGSASGSSAVNLYFSDAAGTRHLSANLGSFLFSDVVGSAFGKPGSYGNIDIRFPSEKPIGAWSRSWTSAADGQGTYGQEIPGFDASTVLSDGQKGVIPAALGGAYRTNVLLTEVGGAAVQVTVSLRGTNGEPLGQAVVASLAAFEQVALNDILAGRGATVAWIEVAVAGTGKIGAIASIVDNATNDPTTILSHRSAPRAQNGDILIPIVAHAGGAAGSAWRSDIFAVNAGDAPMQVRLVFISENGVDRINGAPETIAPLNALHAADVVLSRFGIASGKGSLRIEVVSGDADDLHVISRTYNQSAAGTFGQGVWPVSARRETGNGEPGLTMFGLRRSGLFRTNLNIFETSGNPVTVTVGSGATAKVYSLASNQSVLVTDVLGALTVAETYTGFVPVVVSGGAGRVTAFASMIDMKTNDPTTVPAFK